MAPAKEDMMYFRLDPELRALLDEYRKQFSPIPNRSEAIRQLLEEALLLHNFERSRQERPPGD